MGKSTISTGPFSIAMSVEKGTPSHHPFWIGIFPNENHPDWETVGTDGGFPMELANSWMVYDRKYH